MAGEGTMMRFAMGRKMEITEGDWVRGLGERLARRSIVLVGMPGSG